MGTKAKGSKKKIILCIAVVVFLIGFASIGIYLNDFYRADLVAIDKFEPEGSVTKEVLEDDTLVYKGEKVEAGFIFYPGGKVEYTSYEPLMEELASRGILCVLVEMPFQLAILDVNAADGIQEHFPEVTKWYIGGHSLGGSMAASYLTKHGEGYDGLILLGSYSVDDLSKQSINVLSILGSEDQVLNGENYEENKKNLPGGFQEMVIEGGCHAYFGMYGPQEGDGEPEISNEKQIELTADTILQFATQNE